MFLDNLLSSLDMLGGLVTFFLAQPLPFLPIFSIGQVVLSGIALFLVIHFFERILD